MRKLFAFLFFALFLAPAPLGARSFSRGRIVVHPGGRYLQYADGRPFFYLGDTAWELFHRTTREEARLCLEDRARKGFTVIQAVCLAERDGLRVPNAYGDLPFADAGFTRPNERYFTYVDEVVAMADSLGLVIGLLPAWGDKFCLKWGPGPEIFTTEGRAEAFGRYLGERYRIRRNIIWILGGDRPPEGREPILRAFARGIACGVAGREDYSACLITYHPWGKSSSGDWLHDEPWLAFNMQQNGHAYDFDLWERIARDYARRPVKPVLDGEPIYEEHPIDFDREKYGTSEALHVRRAFYHEVFSGACGHTYGCHAVWQMWEPGRYAPVTGPVRSWRESLSLPGAYQVCYGRELIESRPFFRRIPDQGVIAGDAGRGARALYGYPRQPRHLCHGLFRERTAVCRRPGTGFREADRGLVVRCPQRAPAADRGIPPPGCRCDDDLHAPDLRQGERLGTGARRCAHEISAAREMPGSPLRGCRVSPPPGRFYPAAYRVSCRCGSCLRSGRSLPIMTTHPARSRAGCVGAGYPPPTWSGIYPAS